MALGQRDISRLIPAEPGLRFAFMWITTDGCFEIEKVPIIAWVLIDIGDPDDVLQEGDTIEILPVVYENSTGEVVLQKHISVEDSRGDGLALGIFSQGEGPSEKELRSAHQSLLKYREKKEKAEKASNIH